MNLQWTYSWSSSQLFCWWLELPPAKRNAAPKNFWTISLRGTVLQSTRSCITQTWFHRSWSTSRIVHMVVTVHFKLWPWRATRTFTTAKYLWDVQRWHQQMRLSTLGRSLIQFVHNSWNNCYSTTQKNHNEIINVNPVMCIEQMFFIFCRK